MSNLLEQCAEIEERESRWTQGPALNFLRHFYNWCERDLDRPSILWEIVKVKKL